MPGNKHPVAKRPMPALSAGTRLENGVSGEVGLLKRSDLYPGWEDGKRRWTAYACGEVKLRRSELNPGEASHQCPGMIVPGQGDGLPVVVPETARLK